MGFEETRSYKIWEYLQTQEVPRAAVDIADALKFNYLTTVGTLERLFVCGKIRKVEFLGTSGYPDEAALTLAFWASEKTAFRLRDRWEEIED